METNTKGVIGLVHSKTASDDDVTVQHYGILKKKMFYSYIIKMETS